MKPLLPAQLSFSAGFQQRRRGDAGAREPNPRFLRGTGEGARAEEIPSSATPVPADAKPPTVRTPEVHGEDPPRPSGG